METDEIYSLREWAPLTEVIDKIPTRIQKGIFPADLNITCVGIIPEFIALGTDAGIVFWYNRFNGEVQKLRAEVSSPITCVKVVSSVEYMVAAGSSNGQVSVFQIQKELPPDLNLAAPLNKVKPIERYTIRDLHKCRVTCCEWSKNGMKLFSGDKQGVVVLTEFDYQAHLSKSLEILNEAYDIVQLSLHQSYLLVSTLYRTIICQKEQNNKWRILQVGKKDRKVLSEFGATFQKSETSKIPKIICSRPGLRFWISDCNGNVEQTLIFKDAVNVRPCWEIPILNPSKHPQKILTNFGTVQFFTENLAITFKETALYILNLEHLRVEAIARGFRNILDLSICGKEIFILEGPRSLIRIAACPEPPSKSAKIIFNPLLPHPVPVMGTSIYDIPVEYEAEDEAIINAEECFELPPIHKIHLDTPIEVDLESPRSEDNRRIEIFNQISEMDFEESILHHSGKKPKKDGNGAKKKKKPKTGIVEIGQAMDENQSSLKDDSLNLTDEKRPELMTRPTLMDASFCTDTNVIPDTMSPDTLKRILEPKEKALAEELKLEPVKLSKLSEEDLKKSQHLPSWTYPLDFGIAELEDAQVQTTPRKKLHFISDDDNDDITPDDVLYKDIKNIETQPSDNQIVTVCSKSSDGQQSDLVSDANCTKSSRISENPVSMEYKN